MVIITSYHGFKSDEANHKKRLWRRVALHAAQTAAMFNYGLKCVSQRSSSRRTLRKLYAPLRRSKMSFAGRTLNIFGRSATRVRSNAVQRLRAEFAEGPGNVSSSFALLLLYQRELKYHHHKGEGDM